MTVSIVKVLYKSSRGVMSFDRKKPIYQHKNSKEQLEVGLGLIDEATFVDKGDYAFADIKNVFSVIPSNYMTIEYFENIGVPSKIYKGMHGNSVLLKEEYKDKSFIKALAEDGSVLLQENKKIKNTAMNIYYARLDNVVGDWEDITDHVVSNIVEAIKNKNCSINLGNPYVLYALKRLSQNTVVKAANGVIYATGRYETLVIWGQGNKASMAWLGKCIEDVGEITDIKQEVTRLIRENGIL